MKQAPLKTPQSAPKVATWADVAQASADLAEKPVDTEDSSPRAANLAPASETFPGGSALQAGDTVLNQKFGRCTVHRIVSGFVHMAPENGRVIKLSQNIVTFTPAFIEDGRRVFSTSTRQ